MIEDSDLESRKPAWQTDELQDEWIDQDDEGDSLANSSAYIHSSSDLSLTHTIGSVLVRNNDAQTSPLGSVAFGTFVVREEVPAAPLLPKTPGRNNTAVKDFFSPMPLEKMFEPPSPPQAHPKSLPSSTSTAPAVPSRLSRVYVPSEDTTEDYYEDASTVEEADDDAVANDGQQGTTGAAALDCQFTFAVPRRPSPFNPDGPVPEAQSTPGPPPSATRRGPPLTDPRLRLFQFQYDTFTRDHLSAMVDSIAVNTPSGGSGDTNTAENTSTPQTLSPVLESSTSRLRSAKRIKLSPASDFSESGDGAAMILRPSTGTIRKDYVGESKSLMEKMREKARDFSTVSTVASAASPNISPDVQRKTTEDSESFIQIHLSRML